jgi:Helix-turn-helix domain
MSAQLPRIQSATEARILGVSQRSVQGLALRGELPGAARIGGVWTFDAERLATFVKQREYDAERGCAPNLPSPRRDILLERKRMPRMSGSWRGDTAAASLTGGRDRLRPALMSQINLGRTEARVTRC